MEACWRAAASRLPSSLKEADPVGGGAPCASRPSSAVSCAAALAICAANSVPGSGAGALPLTVPVMRVYGLHNQFLRDLDWIWAYIYAWQAHEIH